MEIVPPHRRWTSQGIPRGLYSQFRSCLSALRLVLGSTRTLVWHNRALRGIGRGRRAFILATGPSIKNQNLELLVGEDTYSASNFYLHPAAERIVPKFHFFAPFHLPMDLNNYVEWLKQADRALPQGTNIFLATATHPLVERDGLFEGREVRYLYLSEFPSTRRVSLDAPVLGPQTVPLMILPVLLYMEYDEIYLIGCDHTVLRDYGRQITNFYPASEDMRVAGSAAPRWGNIESEMLAVLNAFAQYRFYYSLRTRSKIYNLSEDSWLDVFPRKTFNEVLGEKPLVSQDVK
jgi:hypothetical protein